MVALTISVVKKDRNPHIIMINQFALPISTAPVDPYIYIGCRNIDINRCRKCLLWVLDVGRDSLYFQMVDNYIQYFHKSTAQEQDV
jgi:hypothetical protein